MSSLRCYDTSSPLKNLCMCPQTIFFPKTLALWCHFTLLRLTRYAPLKEWPFSVYIDKSRSFIYFPLHLLCSITNIYAVIIWYPHESNLIVCYIWFDLGVWFYWNLQKITWIKSNRALYLLHRVFLNVSALRWEWPCLGIPMQNVK